MISARYLTRELMHSMLMIMLILLVVMISVATVRFLSMAAGGGIPMSALVSTIGIVLPSYIGLLIPLSLFLAIVTVYGRMFADSELLVMMACGLGWWRLLKTTMRPALFLAAIVALLSLYIVPLMSYHQDNLQEVSRDKASSIQMIQTGRFVPVQNGQEIIYIGSIDPKTETGKNIFIYRKLAGGDYQIILSKLGYMKSDAVSQSQFLVLENGMAYRFALNELDMQIMQFSQATIRLLKPTYNFATNDLSTYSTLQLLRHPNRSERAELEWRFSLPIAVLVMAVMAVAICYVPPRTGKYYKLLYAILAFILYFNCMVIARSWIANGVSPDWFGLWVVHLIFLSLALLKLAHMEGRLTFKRE